jgi:hypothetical protein
MSPPLLFLLPPPPPPRYAAKDAVVCATKKSGRVLIFSPFQCSIPISSPHKGSIFVVTAGAGRIEWTSSLARRDEGAGWRRRREGKMVRAAQQQWGQTARHAGPCSFVGGLPACLCTSGYRKTRERERTRHREESREIRERFVDSFHCYSEGKEQGQYSHSMRLKIVGENADMDAFKYSEL